MLTEPSTIEVKQIEGGGTEKVIQDLHNAVMQMTAEKIWYREFGNWIF